MKHIGIFSAAWRFLLEDPGESFLDSEEFLPATLRYNRDQGSLQAFMGILVQIRDGTVDLRRRR